MWWRYTLWITWFLFVITYKNLTDKAVIYFPMANVFLTYCKCNFFIEVSPQNDNLGPLRKSYKLLYLLCNLGIILGNDLRLLLFHITLFFAENHFSSGCALTVYVFPREVTACLSDRKILRTYSTYQGKLGCIISDLKKQITNKGMILALQVSLPPLCPQQSANLTLK